MKKIGYCKGGFIIIRWGPNFNVKFAMCLLKK